MAFAKGVNGLSYYYKKLASPFSLLKSNYKKPYIVPTSFGMSFGGIALVILIFALGSANNVLYIFAFLLISVAVTAMHATNKNMEQVRILRAHASNLFAGAQGELRVLVENTSSRDSLEIRIEQNNVQTHVAQIEGKTQKTIALPWTPQERGWQKTPRLQMESEYPFGLLRSWRIFTSDEKILIYPKKEGLQQLPIYQDENQNMGDQGLFRDHRIYQTGDPVRRIDWRVTAKHQETLIRTYETQQDSTFAFSWEQSLFAVDFEKRISQLALWLDLCEKQGFAYSLRIGKIFVPSSKGYQHLNLCFKILAELRTQDLA